MLKHLLLLMSLICCVGLSGGGQARAEELPLPSDILWSGDLSGMRDRGEIRFLVVYNEMFYFLDGVTQRGGSYELIKLFEQEFNAKLTNGGVPLRVILIPVSRDQLIPALLQGRGDVATGFVRITSDRLQQVDFTEPLMDDLKDVPVGGPNAGPIVDLQDLSARQIAVRQGSSAYHSLLALSESLREQGNPPIHLVPVGPFLEDADLLEMVSAGLFEMTVVDNYKAEFWADIFPHLRLYPGLELNTEGAVGWALRKDSPELKKVLDDFVARHRKGTLYGNILFKRYLRKNRWIRNNLNEKALDKFHSMLDLFRKYADRFQLDWLMLAAIAYQESALDQNKVSDKGAVGVMQLLPSTAQDPQIAIEDIDQLENNIHAGAKYLRFIYDRYFSDEPMSGLNKMLFSIAAYNAGPAKIRRLRKRAAAAHLDPNSWFGHAEVEAAGSLGRETVQYVANVYKYYTAYKLSADRLLLSTQDLEQAKRDPGADSP